MVIALVNRKGGVGKSTSARAIAACLVQAGKKVMGLDADPDRSWMGLDGPEQGRPFRVFASTLSSLKTDVRSAEAQGFDVVIDTPPNRADFIYKASFLADEIIVPLAPTAPDLQRLMATLETIADVEEARSKPLASVLLTFWDRRTVLSRDVAEQLASRQIPLLDSRIRDLQMYKTFNLPVKLWEYERVLKELEIL